jgi:septation ring formation regulator EzrA
MAATPTQINKVVTTLRDLVEQLDRNLAELARVRDIVSDLGMTTLTNADLTGDNAGLAATDVIAAYTYISALVGEDTPARRATRHKIGRGGL